jgi:hypothetical protein
MRAAMALWIIVTVLGIVGLIEQRTRAEPQLTTILVYPEDVPTPAAFYWEKPSERYCESQQISLQRSNVLDGPLKLWVCTKMTGVPTK